MHHSRVRVRGASTVEYIALVGLIALAAFAGVRFFGRSVDAKADDMGRAVARLEAGEGSPSTSDDQTTGADTGGKGKKVEFDTAKFKEASLTSVPGRATIEGPGDGRAIHPNDVSQGQLADCYLISSLAELAHVNPAVLDGGIKRLSDGRYEVTLWELKPAERSLLFWNNKPERFEPVKIIVDDRFPTNKDGSVLFAKPGDKDGDQNELWVMIYEKAYAQWKGGYSAIGKGGSASDVMQAITGAKSSFQAPKDMSFDDFARRVQAGEALVAGTPKEGEHALFTNDTLVHWHAYYVTGVDTKAQTVTVRNPWGWEGNGITVSWADFQGAFNGVYINPGRR